MSRERGLQIEREVLQTPRRLDGDRLSAYLQELSAPADCGRGSSFGTNEQRARRRWIPADASAWRATVRRSLAPRRARTDHPRVGVRPGAARGSRRAAPAGLLQWTEEVPQPHERPPPRPRPRPWSASKSTVAATPPPTRRSRRPSACLSPTIVNGNDCWLRWPKANRATVSPTRRNSSTRSTGKSKIGFDGATGLRPLRRQEVST